MVESAASQTDGRKPRTIIIFPIMSDVRIVKSDSFLCQGIKEVTETKVHIAKEDARMVQLKEVEKESGLEV